jgi:DNA-binding transcriptional ArsR family regulator
MRNSESVDHSVELLKTIKAVSSPVRLEILALLKDPTGNFPPQTDGDLIVDGVCADFIRDKVGIAAATASRHLTLLTEADLLVATRKKNWTFYRRDEAAIKRFTESLETQL